MLKDSERGYRFWEIVIGVRDSMIRSNSIDFECIKWFLNESIYWKIILILEKSKIVKNSLYKMVINSI